MARIGGIAAPLLVIVVVVVFVFLVVVLEWNSLNDGKDRGNCSIPIGNCCCCYYCCFCCCLVMGQPQDGKVGGIMVPLLVIVAVVVVLAWHVFNDGKDRWNCSAPIGNCCCCCCLGMARIQ